MLRQCVRCCVQCVRCCICAGRCCPRRLRALWHSCHIATGRSALKPNCGGPFTRKQTRGYDFADASLRMRVCGCGVRCGWPHGAQHRMHCRTGTAWTMAHATPCGAPSHMRANDQCVRCTDGMRVTRAALRRVRWCTEAAEKHAQYTVHTGTVEQRSRHSARPRSTARAEGRSLIAVAHTPLLHPMQRRAALRCAALRCLWFGVRACVRGFCPFRICAVRLRTQRPRLPLAAATPAEVRAAA